MRISIVMAAVIGLAVSLGAVLAPGTARAQEGMGIGVIAGEPTGISVKTWFSRTTAFSAAAAWSFANDEAMDLHGDYIVHNYNTFPVRKGALPFYYGMGGRLKLNHQDPAVGIRFPLGLAYMFESQPFDLFFEVAPILDITPGTEVRFSAALGARYYLH